MNMLYSLGAQLGGFILLALGAVAIYFGWSKHIENQATQTQVDKQATTDALVRAASLSHRSAIDQTVAADDGPATADKLRLDPRPPA